MVEDIRKLLDSEKHVMNEHRLSQLVYKDERFGRGQTPFTGEEYRYTIKHRIGGRVVTVSINYNPDTIEVNLLELSLFPWLAGQVFERRATSGVPQDYLVDVERIATETAAEIRRQYEARYNQEMEPTPLEDIILTNIVAFA